MTEYADRLAERVAIMAEANNQPEPTKELLEYAELVTQMQYSRTGIYKETNKKETK